MSSKTYSSYKIGNLILKNRIIRSATYEGACDENGFPKPGYLKIYKTLAQGNLGMIITGFSFVSKDGRAMQRGQAGIDSPQMIDFYKRITGEVHKYNVPVIMQITHTGRQTLAEVTKKKPVSCSRKKSVYFRQKPLLASIKDIEVILDQFANSAAYAKEAGFDGVQLHAAHGYLLHQFLLPETNVLKNKYGIDKQTGLSTKLLEEIFDRIKDKCGESFPVLIKISGDHDLSKNFYPYRFEQLIKFLDKKHFDGIEISYGTMEYALNIFRGDLNMELLFKYNPIFRTTSLLLKYYHEFFLRAFISSKFKNFSPAYNLHFAEKAKKLTTIPIISVGGFRRKTEIEYAIDNNITDLVALSRPFICEPDFVQKIMQSNGDYISKCKNCNKCVFMCDSGNVTTCYSRG